MNRAVEPGRKWFDIDVAAVKQGKHDTIDLYDTRHADDLLKSIQGLRGVKCVSIVAPCDATEEGMKVLSTFPDLRQVIFYQVPVTDAYIEQLRACDSLESVSLSPESDSVFHLQNVLTLPKLKVLHTDRPKGSGLEEFYAATMLDKLVLVGPVTRAELEDLIERLPNCKISVERHW